MTSSSSAPASAGGVKTISVGGRHGGSGGIAIIGYLLAKSLLPMEFPNLKPDEAVLLRESIAVAGGATVASLIAILFALGRVWAGKLGIVLCVFAAALSLTSCATLGKAVGFFEEHPLAARIAVQQTVVRIVGDSERRADQIIESLGALQGEASDEAMIIDELQARLIQLIDDSDLELANRLLAQDAVLAIADELRARIADGTIHAPGLVEARAVLGWAVEAAELAKADLERQRKPA